MYWSYLTNSSDNNTNNSTNILTFESNNNLFELLTNSNHNIDVFDYETITKNGYLDLNILYIINNQ